VEDSGLTDVQRVVIVFGRRYDFGRGEGHALKVRDLALKMFDDARRLGLHGMGPRERLWLEAAALLHDVGVSVGGEHHESSKELILSSEELRRALGPLGLKAVAWIAFFHRREPDPLEHPDPEWRELLKSECGGAVVRLAATLRVADALDRSLLQAVEGVELERDGDRVLVKAYSRGDASVEVERAREKARLFERAFGVRVEMRQVPKRSARRGP